MLVSGGGCALALHGAGQLPHPHRRQPGCRDPAFPWEINDPSRTPRRDAAVYTQACVAALAPPCYVENLMNLLSKKNAG